MLDLPIVDTSKSITLFFIYGHSLSNRKEPIIVVVICAYFVIILKIKSSNTMAIQHNHEYNRWFIEIVVESQNTKNKTHTHNKYLTLDWIS